MLNPGVDIRSASRAAEFPAVKRLIPDDEDVIEWAMAFEEPLLTIGGLREKCLRLWD